LFRTIASLGDREIRRAKIPVADAAFLKACGIAPQQGRERADTLRKQAKAMSTYRRKSKSEFNRYLAKLKRDLIAPCNYLYVALKIW
jgi:hypothetical protein